MAAEDKGRCYELILNHNCNARCAFCSQGSFDKALNAPFAASAANIYKAWKAGYRRIGFTGGEPLVNPDIVKLVALAKSVGFRYIRIQTNGLKLADAAFCRELAAAGLTFCKFSFASERPAEHDRLVGVPGAFARAAAGMRHLRALGLRVGANLLVNRLNYRRLPRALEALLGLGAGSLVVIYPVYEGAMAANAAKLGVSLPDCEKYFSAARAFMEKAGLGSELLFLNVPPCFLAGGESLAIGLAGFNTVVTDPLGGRVSLDENADAGKVRAPACARCALKVKCRGVSAGYAGLYGFAGFKAVKAPAPERPQSGQGRYFTDNERCLLEILRRESPASTRRVLRLARDIVLCRDCADGNSVLNAAAGLERKGLLLREFKAGGNYWRLAPGTGARLP